MPVIWNLMSPKKAESGGRPLAGHYPQPGGQGSKIIRRLYFHSIRSRQAQASGASSSASMHSSRVPEVSSSNWRMDSIS